MFSVFTILSLILLIVASIAVHEGAHLLAAKKYNWEITGFKIKYSGFFVALKANNNNISHLWKVALAGPIATLLLCILFFLLAQHSELFLIMFFLNSFVLGINLIPIKPADGWSIIRGLKLK